MIKVVLLLLLVTTQLFAASKNCDIENKTYKEICQKALKNGVSSAFANEFFLTNFKTKKAEETTIVYTPQKNKKVEDKKVKKVKSKPSKHKSELGRHLDEYQEVYDHAEKKYGVNREIVAVILMHESKLGKFKPATNLLSVFNTMGTKKSTKKKSISEAGKERMINLMRYCYKKGIPATECNFPSSHAGNVGIPQFLPENFCYIDAYQAKVGDLNKMEDAIVSTSNYLNKRSSFNKLIDWDKMPNITEVERSWKQFSATNKNSSFVYEKSEKSNSDYNCFRCETAEVAYLQGYVKKIMGYNNSSDYALMILTLAQNAHKEISK
ncbi:MAG: lytic murein transglycosylase [Sulfurimonas sp.]|jgi:membrane-bound lytic murein transglycosylase B